MDELLYWTHICPEECTDEEKKEDTNTWEFQQERNSVECHLWQEKDSKHHAVRRNQILFCSVSQSPIRRRRPSEKIVIVYIYKNIFLSYIYWAANSLTKRNGEVLERFPNPSLDIFDRQSLGTLQTKSPQFLMRKTVTLKSYTTQNRQTSNCFVESSWSNKIKRISCLVSWYMHVHLLEAMWAVVSPDQLQRIREKALMLFVDTFPYRK